MLFVILALMVRAGALKRPGLIVGSLRGALRHRAHHRRIFPRTRRAARLPVGRRDHGPASVHPAVPGRARLHRLCAETSRRAQLMTDAMSPLESEIRRRIAAAGPMPVREYMALCLADPEHGYYTTRDPLGARGDFITAPEISQMFGELIGLWMAAVWKKMGAPKNDQSDRARPRPRHADEGRAARLAGDARFPRRHRAASRRDEPGAHGAAAAHARRAVDAGVLAQRAHRRAGRPGHHHRQRVLRCAAGQPGGEDRGRLARALRRRRRRGQLRLRAGARAAAAFRRPCCRRSCARCRKARSSNGATISSPCSSAAGSPAMAARRW